MARIVLIAPYLKGGRDAAHLAHRMRYVATREGVELLTDQRGGLPASKKQQAYIRRLIRTFPEAAELLEYDDYKEQPTQERANEFIRQARESFVESMDQRENFLDYIAHRPGVQLSGEHGLWDAQGKVRNLAAAVREVAEHPGNVWTPVIALRREDAERLGYDNAANWQARSSIFPFNGLHSLSRYGPYICGVGERHASTWFFSPFRAEKRLPASPPEVFAGFLLLTHAVQNCR